MLFRSVDHVSLHPESLSIYAADRTLTPALAVAIGLTEHMEFLNGNRGPFEQFRATIDGIRVQTHGPIPTVAGWVCPCGAQGWLTAGASDEDRIAHDEGAAQHAEFCFEAEAVPA